MARNRPEFIPLVRASQRTKLDLVTTDEGHAYEGECPKCYGTIAAPASIINIHRDGTFSTKKGFPIGCSGGCSLALKVRHSVAEELPEAEFNEETQYAFDVGDGGFDVD